MYYGWAGRILKVDLTSGTITTEPLPAGLAYAYLGQAGINARILYEQVGPHTDPLGPDNCLIFGAGPLSGTMAPCSGRFSVTAKSPLTGIFADANCGGHWGPELKYAGYDHVVITGRAEHPVYLWINDDTVQIRDARGLWGLDTWETDERIKQTLGRSDIQVACIGPAGEKKVRFASIICNLARAAGRTGMGAVMGSKNLKAIAVRGTRGISVARPEAFQDAVYESIEAIQADPLYEAASTFGTTAITAMAQAMGFLPTRNFQESVFPGADRLRGENIVGRYTTRHKGCFNCPVSCSRYYEVPEGDYRTRGEGPEYESITALGPKCGNDNLEAILAANTLCNRLGLDTISTGNVIAWAMESYQRGLLTAADLGGPLPWGDHRRLIELVEDIGYRRGTGEILGEGSLRAARQLGGTEWVVHSKGMDYPAVDVRGTKGMALGFAVSPRGGDHLKGLPLYEVAPSLYAEAIREEMGIRVTPDFWLQYQDKAAFMIWHEDWHCVVDSLGICKLEGIALKPLRPRHFHRLLVAATGWDVSMQELRLIGARIWNLERLFNVRHGLGRADDLPPPRLLTEPISTGPAAGQRLDPANYNALLDEYYRRRGWDPVSGRPLPQTLTLLGLEDAGPSFP